MTKQKVQLVLRSSDISIVKDANGNSYNTSAPYGPIERTADFSGPTGSINRWQSNMTWNNINLRSVLGNLYKPGGTYNLKLESVVFSITSNVNTYTTRQSDTAFNIIMSGLPFMSSYSSNLSLVNQGLLCAVRVPHGTNQHIFNYNNNELSFSLTNLNGVENVNINIQFRDLLTNTLEPSGAQTVSYPHVQFVFSIYSCGDDKP
jgi:hypothetical protein